MFNILVFFTICFQLAMGDATANFITTLYKGGYISIDDLHLAPVRTTTACMYPRQ